MRKRMVAEALVCSEGWRWDGGPQLAPGQGWWEGSGLTVRSGWKLGSPPAQAGRAPRNLGGGRRRRRRALTSQGRSASRLSPGCCLDSDPRLRFGSAARQDSDSPPRAPAPGLRRGSPGRGSAAPQAPPPRPAGANWSSGPPRTRPDQCPRVHGRPRSCACAVPARLGHTLGQARHPLGWPRCEPL